MTQRARTTWNVLNVPDQAPGLVAMSRVLASIAAARDDIVVLTADLARSNTLQTFAEQHPDRFFNFGIAEQNMISAAAGLATTGKIPYVAGFASFLSLLTVEQIHGDVAWPGLPVRFLAHHAGLSMGFYGTTHHAMEDLAILRSFAGMTIVVPADAVFLEVALRATVDHPGPIYFRIGRGREPEVYKDAPSFRLGEAIRLREGNDVTVIATGLMVAAAVEAAEVLASEGLSARVLDMHTVRPLDTTAVLEAARETGMIVTAEEHSIIGGLGGAVAEVLAESGVPCTLKRVGLLDQYAVIGPPRALYANYGLDAEGIARTVRALAGRA